MLQKIRTDQDLIISLNDYEITVLVWFGVWLPVLDSSRKVGICVLVYI